MNKNFLIWKQICETKFLDFVDIDEVEKIENYLVDHNVTPFIKA